jgi:predicted ribosome quality control (RQC) complex YloA/Tae2 family protein
LVEESRGGGRDVLALLAERLVALAEGSVDPVIETREDPLEAARAGRLAQARCRILPWEPPWPPADGTRRIARGDPSATAGLYYGALALSVAGARRSVSLAGILEREIRRLREVEARIQADLRTFSDPDRYRIAGEALLAGLGEARRAGDHVLVPDPYDSDRGSIPIRAAPGRSLTQVAEDYFLRHRRARRGIERARERLLQVGGRRSRLEALQQQQEGRTGAEAADRLELAMQAEGIPVGLDRVPGRRQEAAAERRARVEGVRLFLSRDGETILVGKSGPANHRLTFKLAAPDDFWLHARGAAGAHVVVRNERRLRRPPAATLTEAAEAAAWFSEAREQPWADVQWTRRKYVRKMRGAPPGTVIVKRSETVRVRPRLPAALEGAS